MPLYDVDTQTIENLPKNNNSFIGFSDGGFYSFLKFFISETTKIPQSNIFIRNYGENNPYLQQGGEPKVICELYSFKTNMLSGKFDGWGNIIIPMTTIYRVYFVNDSWRAPFLFESALKVYKDKLDAVMKKFFAYYREQKIKVFLPDIISLGTSKDEQGFSTYPILYYDVLMIGKQTHNLEELENMPFDSVNANIDFNVRS